MTEAERIAARGSIQGPNDEAYVWQSCHEWRERLPLGKAGYVCVLCGTQVDRAAEMRSAPECYLRLAPLSWLPAKRGRAVAVALRMAESTKAHAAAPGED